MNNEISRRKMALHNLVAGDIFDARFTQWLEGEGPRLICLVTDVTDQRIAARIITTQATFEFSRTTGSSESYDQSIYGLDRGEPRVAVIDSVYPLPVDIHNTLLLLDRKYRLDPFCDDPERSKLSSEEKNALLYLPAHYAAHPL